MKETFTGRGARSSGSQGERSTLFWLYACFSISLITIKPWGLILAPGMFDSAGFKKLLGIPVVRFISFLANGQSDTQWLPRHLLHFQCGGGFAPGGNAFWPLYWTQCLLLYISVDLLIIFEILSSSVSPSLLAPLIRGMLAMVGVCFDEELPVTRSSFAFLLSIPSLGVKGGSPIQSCTNIGQVKALLSWESRIIWE